MSVAMEGSIALSPLKNTIQRPVKLVLLLPVQIWGSNLVKNQLLRTHFTNGCRSQKVQQTYENVYYLVP